jgi:hypothetical protein
MSNKKTLQEKFAEVKAFLEEHEASEEMIDFIADRAEKADRKSENRKPSATQVANAALSERVYEYLKDCGKKLQIKQMIKEVPAFAEIENCTTQKASAIVRGLLKDGKVQRVEEKGVAYFFAI